MRLPRITMIALPVLTITVGVGWTPAQVSARDGFFGGLDAAARIIQALPKVGVPEERRRSRDSGSGSSRKTHDSDDGDSNDNASKTDTAAPKTTADALKDAKNATAAEAEWREMVRAAKLETGRNVDNAIKVMIDVLKDYHQRILKKDVNVNAATGLNINQVTAGELKRGVESAYKDARLFEFERFVGELWTHDRLMVRVIMQAKGGLEPYFQGVGAKGPSMTEINDLFAHSAREVYVKALETSEIVGVSLSFDRFIRTMYEHADREDGLWAPGLDGRYEQPDSKYERLATLLIDMQPRDTFIQDGSGLAADPFGLEKQFQYRFRARRALYDCLSGHYEDFINGSSAGKTIEAGFSPAEKSNKPPAVVVASRAVPATKGLVPTTATPPQAPAETNTAASDGVALDGAALKVATVVAFETDSGIAKRVQTYVQQYCRDQTAAVAQKVRTGKIEPISARSDASVDDNGVRAIPAALPAQR